MKILLLGKNGNLGRGIFHALNQQNEFELIAPNRNELDLTNRVKTTEYVATIKPYAVINSATYTTNKSTHANEAIKISETNLEISNNLQFASRESEVFKYIDIGSASIYECFPKRVILENDFQEINNHMPILPYAKAKLISTKQTIAQDSSEFSWISLILPYIISFNKENLNETSGLFARISKQVSQNVNKDIQSVLLEKYDLAIKRQFVHSVDVGNFCKFLVENDFINGLVHMPKLQQMSLNYFIQKHLEKTSINYDKSFNYTSEHCQHPELGSKWDNLINFNYKFTPERCVESLQSNEIK